MRLANTIAALCIGATSALAQSDHATERSHAPVHAPRLQLDPLRAFRHIEQGAAQVAADRAERLRAKQRGAPDKPEKPAPRPARRPTGAQRYIAAVVSCADADLDVPGLLLQRRADILSISNPGPVLRRDEIRLLDETITTERLPLVIVLVHDDCSTARHRAKRRHPARPLSAVEYGTIVARHLLRQSEVAAAQHARGTFEVAVGLVAESGDITWHAPWVDAPPLGKIPEPKPRAVPPTPTPRAHH